MLNIENKQRSANFSYPSSAAAVVFGGRLALWQLLGLTGNRPQASGVASNLGLENAFYYEAFF